MPSACLAFSREWFQIGSVFIGLTVIDPSRCLTSEQTLGLIGLFLLTNALTVWAYFEAKSKGRRPWLWCVATNLTGSLAFFILVDLA